LICLLFGGCKIQPIYEFTPSSTYYVTTTSTNINPDNTYYVSPTGKDSNPGTLALPWLTPQHASNTAVAGDTVYFRAGTYTNTYRWTFTNSGSAGNYITYQNYNGETVTIQLKNAAWSGMTTEGKDYLKFIGINFLGDDTVGSYGLYIYQSDYVTVKDCTVTNSWGSGIYTREATYVTIDGCEISNCCHTYFGEELLSIVDSSNFEVKNCKVHDPAYITRIGICIKEGSHDGTVHDNEVYNLTGNYQGCIYVDSEGIASYNINIYNNLCHDNPDGAGLGLRDELGKSANHDINFYNNIVYGCGNGFEFGSMGTETFTNCSVINNTFYNNSKSAVSYYAEIVIDRNPAYLTNFVIRNNIIYSTEAINVGMSIYDIQDCYEAGKLIIDHNLFYKPTGTWHGWSQKGTSYIDGDPLFTSIGNKDFSITTGSPAKNAGSATLAPVTDYIGTARPQGAVNDIGAYEYKSSSSKYFFNNNQLVTLKANN
jgi:parallel beta-helix repeat protein